MRKCFVFFLFLNFLAFSVSSDPPPEDVNINAWVWDTPDLYPRVPIAAADSVDPECQKDSLLLIEGIKNRSEWAIRMWDATPRAPEGILFGSVQQLGNYDSCIRVSTPIKGKYCLAMYLMVVPSEMQNNSYSYLRDYAINDNKLAPRDRIYTSLCMPASCAPDEISININNYLGTLNDEKHSDDGITYSMIIIDNSCSVAGETDNMKTEESALWIFTILVIAIGTAAGVHELIWGVKEDSFINSISTVNHTKRLFTIKRPAQDDGLYVFHGVKMIAIFTVYFTHKYLSLIWVSASHKFIEEAKLNNLGIFTGVATDLPCDTFFFVSGAIVGYTFYKSMGKQLPNPAFLIFNRFLRLIPSYYYSIWFHVAALSRFFNGPYWNLSYGFDISFCKDNWWLNLLLINNYVKTNEICLTTSWYVACDFHFFIGAVLLIMILRRKEILGFIVMGIVLVLAVLAPGISTYIKHYDPFYIDVYDFTMFPRDNTAFIERYMTSHNRAAIYLVGMCYGIFMFKQRGKKRNIGYLVNALGWIAAFILMVAPSMAGTKFYLNPVADDEWLFASAVVTLRRPLWGLGMAVLLFVCYHRPIGWLKSLCESSFAVVISKLTYGFYLLHFSWIMSRAVSKREGVMPSSFNTIMDGIGDIIVVTIFSGALYIFLDSPIQLLLDKYIFKLKRQQRKPNVEVEIKPHLEMTEVKTEAENRENGRVEEDLG